MENFRSFGIAGEEARCGISNCTALEEFSLTATVCANQDDLPSNVLANSGAQDKSFIERACCTPTTQGGGTFAPLVLDSYTDTCVAESLSRQFEKSQISVAAIAGGVGGAVFVLAVIGGYILIRRRNNNDSQGQKATANVAGIEQPNANNTVMELGSGSATSSAPPPTAPEEDPIPTAIGHPIPVPAEASVPRTYRASYGK